MRVYFIIIAVLLSVFACKKKDRNTPAADLIGSEQFTKILKDVRLLEGAYSARYPKVDTSAYKIDAYYIKLFQDHGISRERFLSSYSFYASNHTLMMKIEDDIINMLTTMQLEQDSMNRVKNLHVMDSLAIDSLRSKVLGP